MYSKEITIKFREADPAGILFFGNLFALAHDAFEEFIETAGFTWKEWFHTKELMVPIRHTEANFLSPFLPGERYQIEAAVDSFGETSLKMRYVFKQAGNTHAEVTMVHAFLDARSKQKIPIPASIRERLQRHMWPT